MNMDTGGSQFYPNSKEYHKTYFFGVVSKWDLNGKDNR